MKILRKWIIYDITTTQVLRSNVERDARSRSGKSSRTDRSGVSVHYIQPLITWKLTFKSMVLDFGFVPSSITGAFFTSAASGFISRRTLPVYRQAKLLLAGSGACVLLIGILILLSGKRLIYFQNAVSCNWHTSLSWACIFGRDWFSAMVAFTCIEGVGLETVWPICLVST